MQWPDLSARSRRGALRGLGLAALAVGAALSLGASDRGAHGALAMDAQLARLAKLGVSDSAKAAPAGIDPAIWAATLLGDNEPTPDRIALGRKLYFDTRLSADGTVACATCHDVSRGFTDQRNVSEGIGNKLGRRNAPTTLNAMLFTTQFWDGRAPTLEEQAKLPIVNPIEMGQPDGAAVVKAIVSDTEYQALFQKAYGRPVGYDDIGRAIGAFERTLVFMDSPVDRFLAGDPKAISADAQKGLGLFLGKARCVSCHPINPAAPLGSDNLFHNIGVSARHQDFGKLAKQALAALAADPSNEKLDQLALETDMSELGRFMVTKRRADIGGFKTSQLRNLGITGPYMHDGSMQTLWDVMDHYNRGGEANPFLDGGIEALALTEPEIDQLVAFLFAFTDVRFAKENDAAFAKQRERARTQRPFRNEALAFRKVLPFDERVAEAAKPAPAK